MIIKLTRKLKVATENIPDDLPEMVQKAFAEYTHGTAEAYQYQDKLAFIDLMVERLHHVDIEEHIRQKIKQTFAYQLDEYGELTEPSEFLSIEFMEDCYMDGLDDARLKARFTDDYHTNEKIMKIEAIAIKAVMEYGDDSNSSV